MSSQYRSEKDGENIGIIVKNKLMNGLEINLECLILIFNHGFSVLTFVAASVDINTLRFAD